MTRAAGREVAAQSFYAVAVALAVYFRVHVFIYPFLVPVLLAGAFIWGDWEERVVMGALVVALEALTVGPQLGLFAHNYDVEESRLGVTLVGAAYLALLLVVAIRSKRWWPSWAAAFQFLLVVSHPLYALLHDDIEPWAYASGIVIWTWLQLIAIGCGLIGIWAARRNVVGGVAA